MNTAQNASPVVAGRVAAGLIPQAAAGLERLRERDGLSGADAVNRAIILYDFAAARIRDGGELLIRDPRTGETWLVRLR